MAVVSLLLALFGCHEKPVSVSHTNNPDVPVALLLTHDGCKVYRFVDVDAHYFVRCESGGAMAIGGHYEDPCQDGSGRSCPRKTYEEIPTETVPVKIRGGAR